jgi:uncharacterized protein (TIGR02001 family)
MDAMKSWMVGAVALLGLAVSTPGRAQSQPEVSWTVGVASDYVFRGFSQTDEGGQVFGSVDVTVGDFYAGAWASNVDFPNGTDGEIDLYGGYRSEVQGFEVDLGVVAYLYPSQPDNADQDYVELKAAASRAFGPVTLGAAVFWSPDYFGEDDTATYVEARAAVIVGTDWTVSGSVGHQALDVFGDYTTWNLGVDRVLTDRVLIDVRYHDTDLEDDTLADSRIVGSLTLLF